MDNNVPAPFPLIHVDLNHDPSPTQDFFFPDHLDQYPSSKYSSSSSYAVIGGHAFCPQPRPHQEHPHHPNLAVKLNIAQGGPHDHPLHEDVIKGENSISDPNHDYGRDHDHGRPQEYCSMKWMSSKLRIMKKMTGGGKPSAVYNPGSDRKHEASIIPPRAPEILVNDSSRGANSNRSSGSGIEANNLTIIRVCADCNTTKTPLWRSGPTGPKSLCNACGIRQRKARRAMAAAAAAASANGEALPQPNPAPTTQKTKVQQKKKKMMKKRLSSSEDDNDGSDPQPKKKLKTLHPPVSSRKLCFEEFVLKLSEWISDFQGVFPQDEKEAAILLMALSYGLVQADKLS